jgi:hypothetical protein
MGGSTDFTLDRFIPVTFGAAAVVAAPKPVVKKPAMAMSKKAAKGKKKAVKKN